MKAYFRPLVVQTQDGQWVTTEAGTIYVYESGSLSTHDPYIWVCTAVFCRDSQTAELYGLKGTMTVSIGRAIVDLLCREGMKKIKWERYKNGKLRMVEHNVPCKGGK